MVCNVMKVLLMFTIAFRIRDKPLITVGDAIDSFLNINDSTTQGMCLCSKESLKIYEFYTKFYSHEIVKKRLPNNWQMAPIEYKFSLRRWFSSTSKIGWSIYITL